MTKKKTLGSRVFNQFIAFLFCVLFPGFVTAIAPVSWITFVRKGDHVAAEAKICVFFFLPYQTKRVDPVLGIGDRFVAGKLDRKTGSRDSVRSEDEAFLLIHGESASASVPVTPFNIKSVTRKAQAFMDDKQAASLRLFVVANWKFSVIMGGLVSLLTVLYVVGVTLAILQGLWRLLTPRGSRAEKFSVTED